MSRNQGIEIAPGDVFEFYESREIICGVVVVVKDGRLNAISEANREVALTSSRIIHRGKARLDLAMGRDEVTQRLRAISEIRRNIAQKIDLEEVWTLLEAEANGYEADEIAEFIFSTPVSDDQAAAVKRSLLCDKLYFQAKDTRFYPRSAENVEARRTELQKEAERERKLLEGARWLSAVNTRKQGGPQIEFREELIDALKDFALFGPEGKEGTFVKELLKQASIPVNQQGAFRTLVRLGVWREDENLLLHEHGISAEFPEDAMEQARELAKFNPADGVANGREDLSMLDVFTVDSATTRDYDDALSVRELGAGLFEVGIHIADAAELVGQGTPLDREAESRASSVYLPDGRISMLPPLLSEGILSLQANQKRFAISFLITMDSEANIVETKICPSMISVRRQLTYEQVNDLIKNESGLKALFELAVQLRQKRLDSGAVILPIPEIQVYVNDAGMIQVIRYDKETPSQIMVSEWMIQANAVAAGYLAQSHLPSLYRNQAECRPETECVQSEHELFRIYRQRRLFSRAELSTEVKPHCSLGIEHYTTVTSPIRRYCDLIVQRQLKHALAGDSGAYSREQLDEAAVRLSSAQSKVFTIQRKWTRYWILKYIEQEDIENMNCLVLDKNARYAHLLLPELLLEANAPVPENAGFSQGDQVKIRIEKAIAREDVLKIQILDGVAR
ncbi:MAG: ribonuclease catalytic domain-containing protein [Syntrophobacteraceae bacterium]